MAKQDAHSKFQRSPYQYAKELANSGIDGERIVALLIDTGLESEPARIIANSVGAQEPEVRIHSPEEPTPRAEEPVRVRAHAIGPKPPEKPLPTGPSPWEAVARQLQKDGYNGSVVARKLIDEHGLDEDAATALASRLYGKRVNPRGGDTATAVGIGLILAAAGALGTFIVLSVPIFRGVRGYLLIAALGLLGTGVTRVIISMVNANVKDDLRQRRD